MPEALAPAKINLFLHVGPPRPDGYHPVCSLMEKISLFDRLGVEISPEPGVRLGGAGIPRGENTVEKAAMLLERESGRRLGASVELIKEIPVAAGLAGGSSDAAAALKLLVSLFRLEMTQAGLEALALKIGADVPFFLREGPQLAEGVGELLTPVSLPVDYTVVIVTPPVEISTAAVYRLYDRQAAAGAGSFAGNCRRAREALAALKTSGSLAEILHNDLEAPALALCPEIEGLKKEIAGLGAFGTLMSGSGPSVFGLFAGKKSAEAAAAALRKNHPRVWVAEPFRS